MTANNDPGATSQTDRKPFFSWTLVNFWLDCSLLVSLVVVGWISAVIRFVFPPAKLAQGWRLWGGELDRWLDAQFFALCLFAGGVVVHVMLHWSWICNVVTAKILRRSSRLDDGQQTLVGVIVLIVILHLLGAGVAACLFLVEKPSSV